MKVNKYTNEQDNPYCYNICVKSIGSYGQLKKNRAFYSKEGFCSTTYILDSLGYFFYEHGCEGSSYIAMGYYKIKKDTVSFNFSRMDTLSPFISIKETPATNDTTVKITMLTRFGSPLKRHVDIIDSLNNLTGNITPDDYGAFSVNPQKCDSIEIVFLRRFYHKPIRFKINHKNVCLVISMPGLLTSYQFSRLGKVGNFSMLLKKDGLYNLFTKEKEYSVDG